MFGTVYQDVTYGLRSLRRAPGFTMAAVATLALAIGGNTAIFSIVDAVLLKTVPVTDPQRLYFLAHGTGNNPGLSSTYPLFERYRSLTDVFYGVTAYTVEEFKVSAAAGPQLATGQFVAARYHDVLGVPFVLGGPFTSESDAPSAADSLAAVISEEYWRVAFGRDPNVLGKTLVVNGKPVSIVGVTAAGFHGLRPGTHFDITLPLAFRAIDDPEFLRAHDTWTGLNIVARLKHGVAEAQALARADAAFRSYMLQPEQARFWRDGRLPDAFRMARLVPAGKGTPGLRRQYERALSTLMAMVGIFLLIACVNTANLMLVRASAREREVAIRSSLGAGRARLFRQFLTESLLLAGMGGAAGLMLAPWAATAIASLFRVGYFPVILEADPDARIVAFAFGISILTGLAFGVVPAVRGTRVDLVPALKTASITATVSPWPVDVGRALAVGQIAMCVLLLGGTGLLVRTLHNLKALDPGFERQNVLLFYVDSRGSEIELTSLSGGLLDALKSLPGVRAVSISSASPLAADIESRGLLVPGVSLPDHLSSVLTNRIAPGYFPLFGIELLRGRDVSAYDARATPSVAVVSESFARTYFGGSDALGRTFMFRSQPGTPVSIVGIVRDVRHINLREPPAPMVYLPLAQAEEPPQMLTAAIQTTQHPRALEAAVREALRRYHADLVISYVRTMEEQIDASLVRERVLASLATGFGVLALVLACVGLYGVVSYGVTRRTREIGIRIALGAQRVAVLWQVLRQTLGVSAAGIVIGLTACMAASHLVSTFLYGLSDRDPLTLAATVAVLLATALVAGYFPARRAAGIDPVKAIRTE